ncbi:MAG: general secretion pathway protein GspB [Gammaproteobacteria bacterium]
MSFILDALRKSDAERQQQVTPGLATTQQRVEKNPRNLWIPVLVVVLLLNALVVGWIYFAGPAENGGPVPAATPAAATRPPATRSLRQEATEPTVADSATAQPKAAPKPAVKREPVVAVAADVPIVTDEDPPRFVAEEATENIQPSLPRFEQLLVAGIISMPQLHLDMHVYASDPQKRFVFINMSKYREGERLTEGPVVEEITSTGAILNQQGNRFTLERN